NGNRGMAGGEVLGQRSGDRQSSEPALPGHLGNGFVFSNAPAALFEDDVIGSENSGYQLEAA
ncbi:MAG TPA: hypothetical protein VFA65_22470, partial [Bryobacteraceae bacterium]|nr:hypothetical protein [Bryobacteraceae bacterium]